jgi:hypothetical protein
MPWRHMGEFKYSSTILDIGTRWMWAVSFTPRPLYPRRNCARYPLDMRVGGPKSQSRRCGEEKNLSPTWIGTPGVQPVARRWTDWATLAHTWAKCKIIAIRLFLIMEPCSMRWVPTVGRCHPRRPQSERIPAWRLQVPYSLWQVVRSAPDAFGTRKNALWKMSVAM